MKKFDTRWIFQHNAVLPVIDIRLNIMETIYESPEYFLQSQDLSEFTEPRNDTTVSIVEPKSKSLATLDTNPKTAHQKKISQMKKLFNIAQIILFGFSW